MRMMRLKSPRHWDKSPITINPEKVLFVRASVDVPEYTQVCIGKDQFVEVASTVDEVSAEWAAAKAHPEFRGEKW